MKILNDEGQVIGECEVADQTQNAIYCKNAVLEITASCPEIRNMSFAIEGAEGKYRITNMPVFFANKEKIIMATYTRGSEPAGGWVLFERA